VGALEDEELAAVADIDELNLVGAEALARAREFNSALESALQIEDEVAAAVVDKHVSVRHERHEVVVIFATLGQQV